MLLIFWGEKRNNTINEYKIIYTYIILYIKTDGNDDEDYNIQPAHHAQRHTRTHNRFGGLTRRV